jgi:hypothetical protein
MRPGDKITYDITHGGSGTTLRVKRCLFGETGTCEESQQAIGIVSLPSTLLRWRERVSQS